MARAARDSSGKFAGFRVNVESVPRFPVFPANWTLEDPRRRPYFVFWEWNEEGRISYALRLEPGEAGGPGSRDFVRVSMHGASDLVLWLERRAMPGGKTGRLWICPACDRPARFLYLLRAVKRGDGTGYVRYPDFVCVWCSGLRWRSQGAYRNAFCREFSEGYDGRDPYPREPWNPRAVSHPSLIRNEFPDFFGRSASD